MTLCGLLKVRELMAYQLHFDQPVFKPVCVEAMIEETLDAVNYFLSRHRGSVHFPAVGRQGDVV